MENLRNMVEWNALKQLAFKLEKKVEKKTTHGESQALRPNCCGCARNNERYQISNGRSLVKYQQRKINKNSCIRVSTFKI